jgi:hypothetical protein
MTNRIEKGIETIASEVMGAVRLAEGKIAGLTGVFAHLAREHGRVMGLLLRLKFSSDPKLRAELFPTIRGELLSHEKGELAEVYPRFGEHPELAVFAPKHKHDADHLEALISDLSMTGCADVRWTQRLNRLIDAVSRHAEQEEEGFFPLASRVFGRKVSREMLEKFEAAKAKAKKSLAAPRERAAATKRRDQPATRRARSVARARDKVAVTRPAVTKRAAQTANRMSSHKKDKAPSGGKARPAGKKASRPKAG